MKIVYLHQYFNGPTAAGSSRTYEMAKRLAHAGHEVHVVTSDRSAEQTTKTWRVEELAGFTVHLLPVPYSNSLNRRNRILAFLRFAIRSSIYSRRLPADVIFATSTPLTIAIPGIVASSFRRAPMVFEVRDLWPEAPIALGELRNPLLRGLSLALERLAYSRSARIVALSPTMGQGVLSRGYPAGRISVIPNAADLDLFEGKEKDGEVWRQTFPWLGKRRLVLYCGTLGRVNNVSYIAELAAEMRKLDDEVRFVVVGDGAEQVKVRQCARDLGVLDETFFMMGSIPKVSVPALFAAATVTMSTVAPIPALAANSANKFFDSLAAGKPIVINHGGWQAEVLHNSGAGIVLDAHDRAAAAGHLYDFLKNNERLERASAAAKWLAINKYSRDDLAEQLRVVLEGAVVDRSSKL